ncbi:MAG TPA: hypothetical protein VFM21_09980, partial [Terriglobia bacterium]|nr:hypothetical protein [Terriglobia bacterium]
MLRAVSARRPPAPAVRSRPLARPGIGPYRGSRFIALAAVLAGLGFSCASQSPPLPPRVERPQQITDLTITQQGRAIVLRF